MHRKIVCLVSFVSLLNRLQQLLPFLPQWTSGQVSQRVACESNAGEDIARRTDTVRRVEDRLEQRGLGPTRATDRWLDLVPTAVGSGRKDSCQARRRHILFD